MPSKSKIVELDGRTGEGGGQLVRVAISLSALTGIPIRIDHVRGNRKGAARSVNKSGGGLKSQHVSSISWLAEVTEADVKGNTLGSHTLEFAPKRPPTELNCRDIKIRADSAASTLLVFQALFPFLLFASPSRSGSDTKPASSTISLAIQGGTNGSFSLTYEYLDQVLLPSLERLGVPPVKRRLVGRGWSNGPQDVGLLKLEFTPLPIGQTLDASLWPSSTSIGTVERIDISLLVPANMHDFVVNSLAFELDLVFPDVTTRFIIDEDSKHPSRISLLLVAHTSNGYRFGRDWLYNKSTRYRDPGDLATEVVQKVVDDLDKEIRGGGSVDEYLDDQLVVFRALAKGRSVLGTQAPGSGERLQKVDRMETVGGGGSMHAQTARWVVSQIMPEVKWFDGGSACEGVGWKYTIDDSLEEAVSKLAIEDK